jgi:hypothetical protein
MSFKALDSDVASSKRYTLDIDRLAEHSEVKLVPVFGLNQDAFEY